MREETAGGTRTRETMLPQSKKLKVGRQRTGYIYIVQDTFLSINEWLKCIAEKHVM